MFTIYRNLISGQQILRLLALGDVSGDPESPRIFALCLIVPLVPQEGVVQGTLICGNIRSQSFTQRQLMLLQSLATQAALVVQNSQLLAELEYKTMMTERTRLAREIHDGLAQTLGLLKLQAAQMQSYAAQGEWSRLEVTLRSANKILADAYLDARQSIDGLRVGTSEAGLIGWLEQTIAEFSENSHLPVHLEDVQDVNDIPRNPGSAGAYLQEALTMLQTFRSKPGLGFLFRRSRQPGLEVRDDGKASLRKMFQQYPGTG
jgi:two-component system nitrate/nitrite sensor histidine kinase NarX